MHGFDTADSHHAMHAFTWDPGGALYWQEGTFHYSQVETPYGPRRVQRGGHLPLRAEDAGSSTSSSRTGSPIPGATTSTAGARTSSPTPRAGPTTSARPSRARSIYPHKHGGMKQFFTMQWRPTCGCELVSSRHFPDDTQGDYLLNNDIGFQGILRYRVKEDGSGFAGDPVEPLLTVVRPELPPGRPRVRPRRRPLRRRLVQPAGRPHAALAPRPEPRHRRTAGSGGSPIQRRPLVEKPQDRRRDRPRAARPAQVVRGPDPLPRPPRAARAARRRRCSSALDKWVGGLEQERPRLLAAHARGPLAPPEPRRRRRAAPQAAADLPRAPRPRRGHPRALLLARPGAASRSSCSASRSTTSIPASGSKRSAP